MNWSKIHFSKFHKCSLLDRENKLAKNVEDTTFKNQEFSVLNSGKTTCYFKLERGTGQGDPISVYLFILALEIAFTLIKTNNNIEGLNIVNLNFLYTVYADTTFFIKNINCETEIIKTFDYFSLFSGLKINKRNDKCFNNCSYSLFLLMSIFLKHLWLITNILKWQDCKIFTKLVPSQTPSRSSYRRCFVKKVFLKIWEISQENICVRVSRGSSRNWGQCLEDKKGLFLTIKFFEKALIFEAHSCRDHSVFFYAWKMQ